MSTTLRSRDTVLIGYHVRHAWQESRPMVENEWETAIQMYHRETLMQQVRGAGIKNTAIQSALYSDKLATILLPRES
jgi:hypothetical protein